jgi:hypothetical protein
MQSTGHDAELSLASQMLSPQRQSFAQLVPVSPASHVELPQ